MKKLQVAGFLDNSLANGKGLRSVLFTSGCKHNCKGCHNKPMQSFEYGEEVPVSVVFDRIKSNKPLIKGVTFSGGEPFEQAENLSKLAKLVKDEGINIWCYTGYTFEYMIKSLDEKQGWRELLSCIDVLVDGKFEQDKWDAELKYKGSSNQRIIDVKASISLKQVILFNDI